MILKLVCWVLSKNTASNMAERCPLGSGLYWEGQGEIPKHCLENCGRYLDEVGQADGPSMIGGYDVFPDDGSGESCDHDLYALQTEDVSLQRGMGAIRIIGVTDECANCGMEYGAQSYTFTCPSDN